MICDVQKMTDELEMLISDGEELAEANDVSTYLEWASYYEGIRIKRDSLIKHSVPSWSRILTEFLDCTREEKQKCIQIRYIFLKQWSREFSCCETCSMIKFDQLRLAQS